MIATFVTGYWLLVTGYWLLVTGYWFWLITLVTIDLAKPPPSKFLWTVYFFAITFDCRVLSFDLEHRLAASRNYYCTAPHLKEPNLLN